MMVAKPSASEQNCDRAGTRRRLARWNLWVRITVLIKHTRVPVDCDFHATFKLPVCRIGKCLVMLVLVTEKTIWLMATHTANPWPHPVFTPEGICTILTGLLADVRYCCSWWANRQLTIFCTLFFFSSIFFSILLTFCLSLHTIFVNKRFLREENKALANLLSYPGC